MEDSPTRRNLEVVPVTIRAVALIDEGSRLDSEDLVQTLVQLVQDIVA
jgi:hypothetical protein